MTRCHFILLPTLVATLQVGLVTEQAGARDPFRDVGSALKTTASDAIHIYTAPARINQRSALWLGGLLAAGGIVYAYDQDIYDSLKRNEHERFYKPIRETGEFFEPAGYQGFINRYIIGALALGYLAGIDPLVNVSAEMLEALVVSAPLKNLTMVAVGREGPSQRLGPRHFDPGEGRSFPSGHSLTIVSLASVLSHHVDRKPVTVAAYTIAGTVLLQRITSDSHWPSDVFTGATYGWVISHGLLKRRDGGNVSLAPFDCNGARGLAVRVVF